MVFYHCWVHTENDYVEGCDRNIILKLYEYSPDFELKTIRGGTEFFTITANTNHYSSSVIDCINLFKSLPQYLGIEAYGILYVWDDESIPDNIFQVWRLKDGRVEVCKDNILSPIKWW